MSRNLWELSTIFLFKNLFEYFGDFCHPQSLSCKKFPRPFLLGAKIRGNPISWLFGDHEIDGFILSDLYARDINITIHSHIFNQRKLKKKNYIPFHPTLKNLISEEEKLALPWIFYVIQVNFHTLYSGSEVVKWRNVLMSKESEYWAKVLLNCRKVVGTGWTTSRE